MKLEIQAIRLNRSGNQTVLTGVEIQDEIATSPDFEAGPVLLLPEEALVITDIGNVSAYYLKVLPDGAWSVNQITRFGDGPDELRRIDYVQRTADRFVIGNSTFEIVFDLQGQIVSKVRRLYPSGAIGVEEGLFVVHQRWAGSAAGHSEMPPDYLLELYDNRDQNSETITELMPRAALKRTPGPGEEFLAFMGHVSLRGNRLWFVPRFENTLFTFDIRQGSGYLYHFEDERFGAYEDPERGEWVVINNSLAPLPDGSVLIGRGPQTQGLYSIDWFNAGGELLGELQVDLRPDYISAEVDRLLVADRRVQNRVVLYRPNLW